MVSHVLSSELSVKIGGQELKQHNTPTSTLLQHIADALYNGSNLTALSKIVLVDSSGAERDYTTSLTFTVGDTLQVVGTISASASYTVSYVRTYGGSNKYFESSVSFSVASGDQIQITITISLTVSGSLSGASFNISNLKTFIFKVLANQLAVSQLNITYIVFNITNLNTNETADYQVTPSKSKPSSNQVSISGSYTVTFDWALNYVKVKASGGDLYYYTTSITGYSNTQITYSDTITVST
jgi:hypothetical protein